MLFYLDNQYSAMYEIHLQVIISFNRKSAMDYLHIYLSCIDNRYLHKKLALDSTLV